MSAARLRVTRELLGVSGEWLAGYLNVSCRTVRYWERGKYPIPDGIRKDIERLEERTSLFVGACIRQLIDAPNPKIVVYHTDARYHAAHPDLPRSAAWHRAAVGRIALEVPDLLIEYAD